MFEINLVPDIKKEMLKKQMTRNIVTTVCIFVAIACGAVLGILFTVKAATDMQVSGFDNDIACAYSGKAEKGKKSCSEAGLINFHNAKELLTIQDQMSNVSLLNSKKVKLSRIFGLLDVVLVDDDEQKILATEVNYNVETSSLSFDGEAWSRDSITYAGLGGFRKGVDSSYYDFGSYYRRDGSNWVEIPSYCIDEKFVNGYLYGVYHRYSPGCESDMVTERKKNENGEYEDVVPERDVENVYIRRSYSSGVDRENYKNGKDARDNDVFGQEILPESTLSIEENEKLGYGNYYFESKCLVYGSDKDQKFDENATVEACRLVSGTDIDSRVNISNSKVTQDQDGVGVLKFSARLSIDPNVFLASNHFMRIVGPTRQNVTESYTEIREMFAKDVDGDK